MILAVLTAAVAFALPPTTAPITVECATLPPGIGGYAWLEERKIQLSSRHCETLAGPADRPEAWGAAASALAHEFAHVSLQTRDEATAQCWGLYLTRYFIVRVFKQSPAFAQRAYESAWLWYRTFFPPEYRSPSCLFDEVDAFTPLN